MVSKLQFRKFAIALTVCGFSFLSNASAQFQVVANQFISSTADFKNVLSVTDGNPTNFALKTFDLSYSGTSNIRVRFPEFGFAGDVVNVTVRANDGLLSLSTLDKISIKLYDSAGFTPVAEFSGSSILSVSLLAPFENIYSIKFITNPAATFKFKDAMIEIDNSLALSLSEFRIYNFNFQRPCPPVLATTVIKSGVSGLLSLASVDNIARIADIDPSNFATINTTLSLLGIGSAYVEVGFPKDAKAGDFIGFTIGNGSGILDLNILDGLSLITYDELGKIKETISGSSSLNLKLLSGTTDRFAVGFTTKVGSYHVSKVRLVKTAALGLLSSLRIYNSFFYTLNRPPVTITSSGPITFCAGGSVVLTAFDSLGSTNFIWNNGAVGASITVSTAGTYFVQSVDSSSCERRSIPLEVVVNAKPAQPKVALTASVLEIPNDFAFYQWYKNGIAVYGAITNTTTVSAPGQYYVAVIDINGCVNNSDTVIYGVTTGVKSLSSSANISVYPNPAQDIVTIDAPFAVYVTVMDMMGKMVLQQQNVKQINIEALPAGTYVFKLSDSEGAFIGSERINKTGR